jgi:hypothetical protein
MGFIQKEVEIIGSRKSKVVVALFDSGAFRNYIRRTLYDGDTPDDIGFHVFEGTRDMIFANGQYLTGDCVRFKEIHIKKLSLQEPSFTIVDDLTSDVIIGAEIMQQLGIILDPKKENLSYNRRAKSGK